MSDLEKNSNSTLDDLLDSISDEEFGMADKKMGMAAKIADAMEEKGWKHKDLIGAIGKGNPSEVTKWLSGTHNFTMETLIKLERALEINLLKLDRIDLKSSFKAETSEFSMVENIFIYYPASPKWSPQESVVKTSSFHASYKNIKNTAEA